jgi:AraC-like DNA-binding protein
VEISAFRQNPKMYQFDNIFHDDPKIYDSIIVFQIGDLVCDGGFVIEEHKQFCYEISYIDSGSGYFIIDGQTYPLKKGDIVLNLPGELHSCHADQQDPFRYFYIGFNFLNCLEDDSLFHIQKMFDQNNSPVAVDKYDINNPFMKCFHELINMNSYSPLMLKTYVHQIIVMAYRSFYEKWEQNYSAPETKDRFKQTVYEIINYIDNNICKISELSQISNDLGYSYTYLSHIFSKETGFSIQEYFNRKRFERAIKWLQQGELTITQVAENLQYQSIHSFSKAFRKYFSFSPKEYQLMYKNEQEKQ